MNVLIIEDEILACDRLSRLLSAYDASIKVVEKIPSVECALKWFEEFNTADLIFMDFELADGLSFDIFDKVNINAPVIFTTSLSGHALRAFKVSSIEYLLKPISQTELCDAMSRYNGILPREYTSNPVSIANAKRIIQNDYQKRFVIKVGEHLQVICTDNILYLYTKEKTTFARTKDKKTYILDHSLDQMEKLLSPLSFFRANRQYIITCNALKDILTYSKSRLKLSLTDCEDDDILISRETVTDFKKWLELSE